MLAELALWLTTPASLAARRAGYVGRAVALWSRSRRQARAWAPHLARCRAFVAEAFAGLSRHRTAVVLGSGLVQDIPIEAMCAAFQRVVLVDAVHLSSIRRRFKDDARVIFVASDLARPLPDQPRSDPLQRLIDDDTVDFVVSANLLSQMPLPWSLAEPPDMATAARVVRAHLADLAAFRARVCLLTDTGWSGVDRGGVVRDRGDLLADIDLPAPDARWDWMVSPAGEEDRDLAYVHHVAAWRDYGGVVSAAQCRNAAVR